MADGRKYYVLCQSNCKFEGMTKEQILTAIAQAVETGEIKDVDAGFIQTVKTINGVPLKFFVGDQSEYEVLTSEQKENLFAIITNDTTKEDILNAIETNEKSVEDMNEKFIVFAEKIEEYFEKTFKPPAISTTKTLDGAGYYYISFSGVELTGVTDGTHFVLGVVYWDGATPIYRTLETFTSFSVVAKINANGKVIVEKNGGDISDDCNIYISKIWG